MTAVKGDYNRLIKDAHVFNHEGFFCVLSVGIARPELGPVGKVPEMLFF